jgi:hypothetical protein
MTMLEKRAPRLLAVHLKASEEEKICKVECGQHKGGDFECGGINL